MDEYRDRELKNFKFLIQSIKWEHEAQMKKWGSQNRTLPEWLMYLVEEVGELADAMGEFIYREGDPSDIYNESIQIATLAMKIAEMIMSNNDCWPDQ